MHPLLQSALVARQKAIVPLSRIQVGAAVESEDGTVIPGCNIESVIPVLSSCAERTAILTALAQGHRSIRRIAVIADFKSPVPPCGVCRQMILEFAPDAEIIIGNMKGEEKTFKTVTQLIPEPYRIEDCVTYSRRPPL